MLADALLLVLGLTLLVGGGEIMVRGATGLARGLGVSPLAIGLTVVAFGTSAPELAVNLTAALQGRSDISFGNIIGSNMANIGLIVGFTALLRPIPVRASFVSREIPMMLLATAAAVILGLDKFLGRGPDVYSRGESLIFLLLFVVFILYTVGDFVRQRGGNGAERLPDEPEAAPVLKSLLVTAVGLAALIGGADVTVDAAVGLARLFGVSEVIIGLTVLAIGTSLPELVASVAASVRGHVELAIGNVVGSNIFNLCLVLGASGAVTPIKVPERGYQDLIFMSVLSLMLMFVCVTGRRGIIRTEALALLVAYLGYMVWRSDALLAL